MKKQIRLNAFAMNCVAHQSPGLWTHPRDRTIDYNRLPYWLDLAKTLERGRFDGLYLTEGRIGWNVVTGYLDSAARGAGKDKQTAHDDRYDIADEYMELVYKLWEGSWEDGAVLRDRARGIFADPAKVHRIAHEGNNYRLNAIHLSEPSPHRTPVLYQAGTSPPGRQFAAQHAECVFMSGPSAKIIAPRVSGIRELAAKAGRNSAEILMFSMMTIILGRTEAEAAAKYADYVSHISP